MNVMHAMLLLCSKIVKSETIETLKCITLTLKAKNFQNVGPLQKLCKFINVDTAIAKSVAIN